MDLCLEIRHWSLVIKNQNIHDFIICIINSTQTSLNIKLLTILNLTIFPYSNN